MRLEFVKMHGLGNDFIVVDATRGPFALDAERIRSLADRHEGIGFDQLLVIEPARGGAADFRYRIFNADGNEAEHCGNGARCLARFVHEQGLSAREPLVFETGEGRIGVRALAGGDYQVDMGVPELEPARIPFVADARAARYTLTLGAETLEISAVSMGNPHAVLHVADLERAPVHALGPRIERHARFPHGANVGFCRVLDRATLALRVWERGVGETRACGTGACAAVVSARLLDRVDDVVTVRLNGGQLRIEWPGEDQHLLMSGPAARVFDGSMEI